MQYDLKFKLNKIDSSQYKNLKIPEMDWVLNESIELFIKNISQPRFSEYLGMEKTQRNIEDIRTLVVPQSVRFTVQDSLDKRIFYADIPQDYLFYMSARADGYRGECRKSKMKCYVKKHGDFNEESPFDSSSFEWEDINIMFDKQGIAVYTDGTFVVDKLYLDYIKKHPFVHNAEDHSSSGYRALDGSVLTGTQDCILPAHTHREIVDIAVLIITGNLIPDYQVKQQKVNINKFN